jgi:hypothetical protein
MIGVNKLSIRYAEPDRRRGFSLVRSIRLAWSVASWCCTLGLALWAIATARNR